MVLVVEAVSVVVVVLCVTAAVMASDNEVVVFIVRVLVLLESGGVELSLLVVVVELLVGVVTAISIVEYSMIKPRPFTLPSDLNLKSTNKAMHIPILLYSTTLIPSNSNSLFHLS